MKMKFDVTGSIKKMTGFDKLEGDASLDAHFEIEFGPEELGMMYQFQKEMLPEILNFAKEMQQLTNRIDNSKMSDLEINELESKIEGLEIQLNGERERHLNTQKERDEYFDKYIKQLDENTRRHKEEIENLKKECEELNKAL